MRTLAGFLILLAAPAWAQGNLPPDFYPKPACERPPAPGKPPEAANQPAMQAYNARVKRFNAEAETFNACMRDYSAKA